MSFRLLSSLLLLSSISSSQPIYSSTIYGAYQTDSQDMLPLILSKNQNNLWQQSKNIVGLPAGMQSLNINDSTCSSFTCAAIGTYKTAKDDNRSLLLTSNDQINWQTISEITGQSQPLSKLNSYLIHTKCNAAVCIATGYTSNTDHSMQAPMLYSTNGNASNWQLADIKISGLKGGYLSDIAFSNYNVVVVGGYYQKQNEWKALLLISHDNGATWIDNQSIEGLPNNYVDFSNINCNGNHCVISARNVISAQVTKPAFLTSDDSGATWHFVKNITLPANFYNGNVFTLHCQDNFCLAVGDYFKSPKDQAIPFILSSNDNGNSWNYINSPYQFPLSAIQMTPVSISCSNSTSCLIESSYITLASEEGKPEAHPYLLAANFDGNTWNLTRTDSNLPDLNSLILISANCNSDACTVIGSFKQNPNSTNFLPVIFTSVDQGVSWKIDSKYKLPANTYFDLVA